MIEALSYIALAFGIIFFTYALRYYTTLIYIALALLRKNNSNNFNGGLYVPNNGFRVRYVANGGGENNKFKEKAPMISIHVPLYNEEKVVDRLMEALVSLDYPRYEVIVVDDSTDSTPKLLKKWMKNPKVKIIHRENRRGFKGGALQEALKHMNEEAEYAVVFDADFIPPKDILWTLLQGFYNGNGLNNRIHPLDSWRDSNDVVAVQGYQWHILNASENWVTKAITAEYAGNYLVDRTFVERFEALRMISGSVFMIRADILRCYGWRHRLTEDWDLTLRLYRDGYKVRYIPIAAAPAECPSTITALIRQRARWSEGHTFAVKHYFWDILRSKFLSFREKLEFLYLTPYYFNSFFFIIGTFAWLLAEAMGARVSFWTSIFGWSLVLTNLMAVPLVNLTGLYMEYRAGRHWTGAIYFIPLMHLLAFTQAAAALRGLIERKESAWFRTLKTGKITELKLLYRIRRIIPRRRAEKIGRQFNKFFYSFLIAAPPILTLIILTRMNVIPLTGSIFLLILFVAALIMINRRKILKLAPIHFKTLSLISLTIFMIIFITSITPAQAPIPTQTLYFRATTSSGCTINLPCQLSPTPPGTASYNQLYMEEDGFTWYYWRSTTTYTFTPADSGTWQLHLEGRDIDCIYIPFFDRWICPDTAGVRFTVQIRVGSTWSSSTQVGSDTFDVYTSSPLYQFSVNRNINVNLPSCSNCRIWVRIKAQSLYTDDTNTVILHTGVSGFRSWLLIPENPLILLSALAASCLIMLKIRRRPASTLRKPRHIP